MGDPKGFLTWQRQDPSTRDPSVRTSDFREFYQRWSAEQAHQQAGRCMDCGVPFCQQGCPLGNQIPDWNDLVHEDRWQAAYRRLRSTNNFPEFTGRLCPAPCEAACTLAINDDAVSIEQIEKAIAERAFEEGWVAAEPPAERTGQRIAIVGSGPAGLAAAEQLNHAGHEVVVFEAAPRLGGLLRYGIPDFKLEKQTIDRRTSLLEQAGITFRTSTPVGEDPSWSTLQRTFDAVLVATGAARPRDLDLPGRELPGIHFAMDFLTQQNEVVGGERETPEIDVAGKHVVILGGGDTGSDCLGTSLRQGAASVTQVELFPAPPEHRLDGNPWPQWPLVFRTSSSQEEGGERAFAVMTKRFVGEGRVQALDAVHVEVVDGPQGVVLEEVPDSAHTVPCDVVLLALGFTGPVTDALVAQTGVELDGRGNLATDARFETSVPGLYAAGDARRGASLIVWAISEGREAARCIDRTLRESESVLPTRGVDRAFGGR